jgi:hypothetical protein
MSEFKKWLSPKDQILYALYKQKPRVGYGFNELRDACDGLHGRYIDIFTNPKKGKLVKDGFIVIKKVMGKGGTKELRMITEKGVEYVQKNIVGVELAVRNVLRLAQTLTEKERFEVLGQVFKDMFEYASSLFLSGKRADMMRIFRDSIQLPVKEFLNKQILDDREYIVKALEGHGEFPSNVYSDIVFIQRQFSLPFLIRDADLAWDLNHYLNSHHVYILTLLGIHSKEEIEQKNKAWLEKNRDAIEPHSVWQEKALKELERRKEVLREIMNVPKDYGKTSITFYNDIT